MTQNRVGSKKSGIPNIPAEYFIRQAKINALSDQKREPARLKYLVTDILESLLDSLRCRSENKNRRFYRPERHQLVELDRLIFSLAKRQRKKELTFDEAVSVVDERWTTIKVARLRRRLEQQRRELELPELELNSAARHFHRIEKVDAGNGSNSALAKDFLRDHTATRDGKTRSPIKWSKYHDLLVDESTSVIRLQNDIVPQRPGDGIVYYAKYLELHLGQLQWEKKKEERERDIARGRHLTDWSEQHRQRDAELARVRANCPRWKGRRRQKKARERKKVSRISVT